MSSYSRKLEAVLSWRGTPFRSATSLFKSTLRTFLILKKCEENGTLRLEKGLFSNCYSEKVQGRVRSDIQNAERDGSMKSLELNLGKPIAILPIESLLKELTPIVLLIREFFTDLLLALYCFFVICLRPGLLTVFYSYKQTRVNIIKHLLH